MCFCLWRFLGLLLGMVGGISVACGNYTQQWAIQAQTLLLVLLLLVLDLPRIFVLKLLYLVPCQMSSV